MPEAQNNSPQIVLVPINQPSKGQGGGAAQDEKFIEKVAQRVLELMQQEARIERERRGGGR